MSGGLHFESLADMPEGMRRLVAGQKGQELRMAATCGSSSQNKYHNIEVDHKNIHFKSLKEARRYDYLMYALEEGWIEDLRLQTEFTLQAAYTKPDGERVRAIRYLADFTYRVGKNPADPLLATEEDRKYWGRYGPGEEVVEDVKSRATRTKTYIMKRKMMEDRLGICIREV